MLTSEQRRQLNILGYTKPESRVRVRCFAPKKMPLDEQVKRGIAWQKDEKTIIPLPVEGWLYPNKGGGVFVRLKKKSLDSGKVELDGNGNAVWIKSKTYQDGIAYLNQLNTKGYGIYLIPNEGGGTDADITRFPALFYEFDEISKDEQYQKLRELEAKLGRTASMVIETRNSLHCYFRLDYDGALPSTWTQYQQRLIQEQNSDDGIWNPSRLMRLAGFDHQKWNVDTKNLEQFPVRLVQENNNVFSLDEFNQILPEWDKPRWEKEHKTSKRVSTDRAEGGATDSTDDPRDIRNFSHYLDGLLQDGRRGWSTCKCPGHNGESDNSLHINQTTGQFKCHAGCSTKEVYYAAVELAKARGYQFPEKRTGKWLNSLDGWLFNLKKRLAKTISRRSCWGVGGKNEIESEAAKNKYVVEYQPDERLDTWASAIKRGNKFILDNSATGTGKSHDTGKVTPELFGAEQVIYLSNEHRNPTVPTLKCWPDLEARHPGLYINEFGKWRRVSKPDQPYVIPPNCGRYGTINALRSKNIPGADTSEKVCLGGCKFLETCRAGVGAYDYLFQRGKTLPKSRRRGHPSSLADENEYPYSEAVLLWDEPGEILKSHRAVEVSEQDLNLTIAHLALKLPEAWDALRPLMNSLHEYLSGQQKQPNKFGWNDTQIRELLPKLDSIDVAAIADALRPDLGFLNTTAEYGVDLADLPRKVRKGFSDSDATTAERVSREVALNWLPDFLNVLLGNVEGGSIRIQHEKLTITLPDQRLINIARAAKANIFLDATADAEDLARVLGLDDGEQIVTMRQAVPETSNLELIQLATMGRLGIGSRRKNDLGEDTFLQKRIDALITQIQLDTPGKTSVIDFKKFTKEDDGKRRWWTDSRGLNDFEDVDTLILVGVPCRNLADLEAEFTVMYNRTPKEGTERVRYQIQVKGKGTSDLQPYFEMEVSADPDFREFCRRRILADIHQAIGRLRAHRRPGQQLKVYFIGDYPLDIPVTLKKASDVTPEAASKVERVELAIRAAFIELKTTGKKITQEAIAAITGYSQQYISRFRFLLQMLLNPSNSICSKNGEPPPDPNEVHWQGQTYFPLLASESPNDRLSGVLNTLEAYGANGFQDIWNATPADAQVKILQALMFTLNAGELRSLFDTVTVT